ncbi:hypothetical protein ONZ45_g16480 [Pleurotus djamor]|nr:hypothetical protein ONZ45_g16480 [Pleurotus djamor]
MLALCSFFEAHASRQTSINELHNIGTVLLSALDVSLRYQNATTGINAPNLKQSLLRLLAAVNLTQTTDGYWFKPSDVRRWMGPIPAKYKPALFNVVNHFACINQHSGGYTPNVAFSRLDSTHIVFTSIIGENMAVSIWDGSIQPPKTILNVPGERSTISCDGSHIAVGDRRNVSIIDTTTKPPLVIKGVDNEDPNGIRTLCLCNNYETLATGDMPGRIQLWRWEGDKWKVFKSFKASHNEIYCLAFSRDGSRLGILVLFTCIKVWSSEADALIKLDTSRHVVSFAWSPSGGHIVSGTSDGIVKIWSADRRQIEHTFKAHDDWIRCLTFQDDGQVLATGSDDRRIRVQ